MSKLTDFTRELQALLAKYDATIEFEVGDCSDTHGLYDERMAVSFFSLKEGHRWKTIDEQHTIVSGWSIDQHDLN